MSASLVGSEMCIRDRRSGGRPQRQEWPAGQPPRGAAQWGGGISEYLAPVSYTHLTLPTICSV
eukprot:5022613-Alexandrium_andersonii.AAC.1